MTEYPCPKLVSLREFNLSGPFVEDDGRVIFYISVHDKTVGSSVMGCGDSPQEALKSLANYMVEHGIRLTV